MSTRSTGLLSRPIVYRAPDEPGSRGSALRPAPRFGSRSNDTSGETDLLLRRSHALVEQLRRAVEARQNLV